MIVVLPMTKIKYEKYMLNLIFCTIFLKVNKICGNKNDIKEFIRPMN